VYLIKFSNLLKVNILLKNTHLQKYASELIKFYSKTFISYFLYDIININWNLLLKKYSNYNNRIISSTIRGELGPAITIAATNTRSSTYSARYSSNIIKGVVTNLPNSAFF